MKYKKLLLVCGCIFLFSITTVVAVVIFFLVHFYKTSKLITAEFEGTLRRSEIKYLEKIQVASVENHTIPESIINKINQRISFLKDSLDLEWNEGFYNFDRIACLVDLENDFRAIPASDICKMINENIVMLRSNLIQSLTTSHIDRIEAFDKTKASAGKDVQWFYVPIEVREPTLTTSRSDRIEAFDKTKTSFSKELMQMLYASTGFAEPRVSFFSEGGSAISYFLKGSIPSTDLIEELSKYYNNLNLIPLKYDLCQPGRLAGLSGGWYEDQLWTQCWVDKKREKVIGANIIRFGEPVFGLSVVIFNSSSNSLKDALSYYETLPDPESNKTVIDGKFFSFRPID